MYPRDWKNKKEKNHRKCSSAVEAPEPKISGWPHLEDGSMSLTFYGKKRTWESVQFSSVAQSCPTLCDPTCGSNFYRFINLVSIWIMLFRFSVDQWPYSASSALAIVFRGKSGPGLPCLALGGMLTHKLLGEECVLYSWKTGAGHRQITSLWKTRPSSHPNF